MQSNSAQSVPPKPALLLFLLLLLLLQHLLLLRHLPTTFSNFSNPTPPSSKSIPWWPLQPSFQPSSQVPHHNKPTLALFPLPAPQAPPLSQYSIYLTFSYFSDLRLSFFGTPLRSVYKNKYAVLSLMDFELCCIYEM